MSNHIFYSGFGHYECQLQNAVKDILSIMNSSEYDRFESVYSVFNDNYTLNFKIYKNQIFFDNILSLKVYKMFPYIRKELIENYELNEQYYEPTETEIFECYADKLFCKDQAYYRDVKFVNYNLKPIEYLKIFYDRRLEEFKLYKYADILDASDIRNWINYNANIFMNFKCSWNTRGVYNEETMNFINSVKETKADIYKSLYKLAIESKDMKKTVKDLLLELKKYKKIEKANNPYYEMIGWNLMYRHASYDLLVQFVGFDKIETQKHRTITTTKGNVYEEFFNYFIMDYDIVQLSKLIFDSDKQKFRWIKPNEFITTGIDRECEKEIQLIKKYVPYDQRYKYLR